jgi:Cdc25 family phosphatase
MLGVNYISPQQLRGMIEAADWGGRDFVIVDLRDHDFAGGHIPGCQHIPSKTFMPAFDAVISRLQGARMVIFHCLISMHRAPMCAKIYKERLMKSGHSQDVAVLEGGFHSWREHFTGNPRLIEGETLAQPDVQNQLMQGVGLGEQFLANVRGSMPQGPSKFMEPQSFPFFPQSTLNAFPFSSPRTPRALYRETIPPLGPVPGLLGRDISLPPRTPRALQRDSGHFWGDFSPASPGGDVVRPLSSDRISAVEAF